MQHTDPGEEEQVALVALLGEQAGTDSRRVYAGWSAVATEVARRRSALAVWNERHPLTLDGQGESDAALVCARNRLARWRAGDFDIKSLLNRSTSLNFSLPP